MGANVMACERCGSRVFRAIDDHDQHRLLDTEPVFADPTAPSPRAAVADLWVFVGDYDVTLATIHDDGPFFREHVCSVLPAAGATS